jgi:uncharacterized RDD family membrane protein YckC
MEAQKCRHCGQEIQGWVELCPHCSEPVENYARPAGFWVRLGAYLIDFLVFIPIMILGMWNTYSLKSSIVLVLISLPGLFYKPVMESFWWATLGKMACGIKVIDDKGNRLSLPIAYARFFLFFLAAAVGLVSQLVVFSSPEFQTASSWIEAAKVKPGDFLSVITPIVSVFIIIDCIVAAFAFRKRALHDMLVGSFCVYKGP